MTPYYQDDAVTIYHGDCGDVLPTLHADAVITDAPYNADFQDGDGTNDSRPSFGLGASDPPGEPIFLGPPPDDTNHRNTQR